MAADQKAPSGSVGRTQFLINTTSCVHPTAAIGFLVHWTVTVQKDVSAILSTLTQAIAHAVGYLPARTLSRFTNLKTSTAVSRRRPS